MLQIIDNALNTVRMDPDHGELMYQVLYLTYFSKKKPANREVILAELSYPVLSLALPCASPQHTTCLKVASMMS